MKHVAICVGHSRTGDSGSLSVSGQSEWDYNEVVADVLGGILKNAGIKVNIFDYYQGEGYGASTTWLASVLNENSPDCAIELHFNASPEAEGFEYIHWESSLKGKRLASCLLGAHAELSLHQKNRGLKEANFDTRGAAFLRKPSCPCVICEPFFGTSEREWAMFGHEEGRLLLASIYAKGLADFLGSPLTPNHTRANRNSGDNLTRNDEILSRLQRVESELAEIKLLLAHEP